MKAADLYTEIQIYCKANADEAVVKKYARFFKEGYDAYGLSREIFESKIESLDADSRITQRLVISTSKLLVKSGKYEETSFAMLLLALFSDEFTLKTFEAIEQWFKIGMINWGHTDVTCSLLLGPLLEKKIISRKALGSWRNAKNKYQRRAVPVALIEELSRTKTVSPLFPFIEPLMLDEERMVQQGLGWFIREVWKIKPKEAEAFLLKWKETAPRVIIQYATEKMTPEQKQRFKRTKRGK